MVWTASSSCGRACLTADRVASHRLPPGETLCEAYKELRRRGSLAPTCSIRWRPWRNEAESRTGWSGHGWAALSSRRRVHLPHAHACPVWRGAARTGGRGLGAWTLEQLPDALDRAGDVEEPADQRLDSCQRPPLVRPALSERTALQLPLQPGDLGLAEFRPSRRALRQQPRLPVLAPGPAPSLRRPDTHPQRGSDRRVLLPTSNNSRRWKKPGWLPLAPARRR